MRNPTLTHLQKSLLRGFFLCLVTLTPLSVSAQESIKYESSDYITTVIFSLITVLVLIFGAAFLLKRFAYSKGVANGLLKVVGGVSLGNRERLVIIEVDGQQMLLGVTTSEINLIKELQSPDVDKLESQKEGHV